jgi:catechol 2,3-dioxygenase-like lactoylglutathione lyase family enzyme
VLGRFHEIGIATPDIRASVEFYESLGFTQATTTDTWSHPYGVLTDGRVFIGLHQRPHSHAADLTLTFVQPDLASHLHELERLGVELETRNIGDHVFNEIDFRDPSGQRVSVIEARTYSPVARSPVGVSPCGYFAALSLPARSFSEAQAFWEPLGFVAVEHAQEPYEHLSLTSDHLDIAFHHPRTFPGPLLVFGDDNLTGRLSRLQQSNIPTSRDLPRGLTPATAAVLRAPEGTALLLIEEALLSAKP